MKKSSDFIFFSEFYYPSTNTTSYYLTAIMEAVAKKWQGRVKIFCSTDLDEHPELLQAPNIKTYRFSGGKMSKNSLVSRVLKFLLITIKFGFAAIFHVRRGDTVFTVTNPAFLLVVLAMLRKLVRFNYVLLVYDIFPETLVAAKLSSPTSFKYRLTLRVFNWAYRCVDKLIVIGRDMEEVVAQKTGRRDNIVLIPNWSDPVSIKPISRNENYLVRKYDLQDKLIFALGGNIGRTQGIENLLEGFQRYGTDHNAALLIMGGGAKKQVVNDFIAAHPELPVIYTGYVPDEYQNDMVNAGDVAMISLDKNMYGLSVPSKSYFNLAAGKPLLLIADETSEIALLIKEHGLGWVVPPGEPDTLVETLKKIATIPREELEAMGQHSREIAKQYFTPETILPQYTDLFMQNMKN